MATATEQFLLDRKAALEETNAGIALQIEELEAQEAANTAEIAQIQAQLDFISAGYPAITTLGTPGTFTGVATAAAGVYSTVLNWDNVTNATGYKLERALMADFSDAEEIYSGATSAYDDEDADLTFNNQYYYRVKATAAGYADSAWAEVIVNMYEQLAEPQNADITIGDTQLTPHADEVPLARGYDFYRYTSNDYAAAVAAGAIAEDEPQPSYLNTGLVNGTTYHYWIVAKSSVKLNSDPAYAGSETPVAP